MSGARSASDRRRTISVTDGAKKDFASRAHTALGDWLFFPPGASAARTADYDAVAFPEEWDLPTQVVTVHSNRSPDALVVEVFHVVREWGRPDITWVVTDDTRPASLEPHLRRIGADLAQTPDWLAYDLSQPLPDEPVGFDVRFLDSAADVDAFDLVQQQGWGHPPASPATRARWLTGRRTEDNHPAVVMTGGRPVSSGGVRLVDGVARVWGGVTVPDARGRGAYRAGVAARLRFARDRGAEVAIVKARTGTSGPILRRVGFEAVGQERAYRLALPTGD